MKIPDKYLDKIEQIERKNWYYILAGVLVVLLFLDYFLLMKPQLGTLMKINPEIKLLSDQITRAQNDIQRLSFYRGEIKRLNDEISDLHTNIKSKDEVPVILQKISLVAEANGVKINQIMPIQQDLEMLLESGERKYFSIPIQVEARSGYHNFARFLNQIEQNEHYLSIGTYLILGEDTQKEHRIKLSLEAVVFE
ncbi:MAG: type 4a pilus biogenesis protein PilO [Candidatus Omnitrophica bacterium]|nr:type 4a pilus biogenesis protein PilO [Candidatus Omnitrophota bacterium]